MFVLQLTENRYEVIAESHPLSVQKRSVSPTMANTPTMGPVGGISVTHPLQATVYAHRQGLMKLLVPFELTVVPTAASGIRYPEVPAANGYPISGQVKPQQYPSYLPNNRNNYYQQYPPPSQFGPSYYPSSSYRYPYTPYYPSYNTYSTYTGYNPQYRNPYYGVPARRVDISQTKPWPQYRPTQQVGKYFSFLIG